MKKGRKLAIGGKRKIKIHIDLEKLKKMQSNIKFRKIFDVEKSKFLPGERGISDEGLNNRVISYDN